MLSRHQITDRATWTALAPHFHIDDAAFFQGAPAIACSETLREDLREQLRGEGFFHARGLGFDGDPAAMAQVVRTITAQGLPAVFAFVYDEFWRPFRQLRDWYDGLLGNYVLMPEFWAWNLEPKNADAGWGPHRDKDHRALGPDRMPRSITTWIPLSPATPRNGCMYIVPASRDPAYGTPRDMGEPEFGLNDILALPAEPGDVLVWSTAVMHWGGKTMPGAEPSRVSISFEMQRTDVPPYNQPSIAPGRLPPFDERLRLIAAQILRYRNFQTFTPEILDLATWLGG